MIIKSLEVKEDKLKDYPLSATDLVNEIKRKSPNLNRNRIWEIIKENGIKSNKDYSDYSFRNQNQRLSYENENILAQGTPSIYKSSTIDLIINIHKNESS